MIDREVCVNSTTCRLLRLEVRASQPRLNRLHFGTDVLLPVGHARRGQEGRREGGEEGGNIENRCLAICRKFAKCSRAGCCAHPSLRHTCGTVFPQIEKEALPMFLLKLTIFAMIVCNYIIDRCAVSLDFRAPPNELVVIKCVSCTALIIWSLIHLRNVVLLVPILSRIVRRLLQQSTVSRACAAS